LIFLARCPQSGEKVFRRFKAVVKQKNERIEMDGYVQRYDYVIRYLLEARGGRILSLYGKKRFGAAQGKKASKQ
jgi:hypothetical protein